jgi:hypothetical protein
MGPLVRLARHFRCAFLLYVQPAFRASFRRLAQAKRPFGKSNCFAAVHSEMLQETLRARGIAGLDGNWRMTRRPM